MTAQASKGRVEHHAPPPANMHSGLEPSAGPRRFNLAEIRQLIALMDTSDLVEIMIEFEETGVRLALRKTTETVVPVAASPVMGPPGGPALPLPIAEVVAPAEVERLAVTAPLVGMWFPAMRTGQKPFVAPGDLVREGQIIGAIETLRVMNEVESPFTGKVRTILVKPGQAVEYGQPLIELDPPSDEPGA